MEQLKQDINTAIKFLQVPYDVDNYHFAKYCTAFIFGCENQKGINDVVNYKNKDVCTVCGSGDQYLGSIYYRAKSVTLYDINRFQKYIAYLKIVSIMQLSYQEFEKFFMPLKKDKIKNTFWKNSIMKKLLPYLPDDVAEFWAQISFAITKYGYGSFVLPTDCNNLYDVIYKGMLFYADEKEYYKLQYLLLKKGFPRFEEIDLLKFSQAFKNDSFDLIYLSNIIECLVAEHMGDFVSHMFFPNSMLVYAEENRIEHFYLQEVEKQIIGSLKDTGTVMVSYRPNSYLTDSSDYLFSNSSFEVNEIPAKVYLDLMKENYYPDKDLVLTYKHQKKGKFLGC